MSESMAMALFTLFFNTKINNNNACAGQSHEIAVLRRYNLKNFKMPVNFLFKNS